MTPPEIARKLRHALHLHQSGDLKKAVEIYQKILDINPRHPEALHLMGFAACQAGDPESAVALIRRALFISPDCALYHNSLGLTFKALDRLSEALSCYRRALELDPHLIEAHNNMGIVLQDMGKIEDAVSSYQKALEINPELPETYNNLGNACLALKNPKQALHCYQKAVGIRPDYPEAHYNMGNALQMLNRFQEAVMCYRRALENRPDYPEAFYDMGNACQKMEDYEGAVICYQKAAELQPDFYDAYMNMGTALHQQGKFEKALLSYGTALEINSSSHETYHHMGVAFQCLGRFNEALDSWQKALKQKPDDAEACHKLAILLQKQCRADEALIYYHKTLELKPDYAEALHNTGTLYQERRQTDQAVACFRKALSLKPDLVQTHVSLGNTFKDGGQLDDAFLCYQTAIRIDPNHAKAHAHLAHLARETCSWKDLRILTDKLDRITKEALEKGARAPEMPFLSLMKEAHPSHYLAVSQSWSRDLSEKVARTNIHFSFDTRRYEREKIRIGYVSNNFRNHPNAHLTVGLFGLHDRNAFDIICYSYGPDDASSYRKRIRQECDKFVDIRNISDTDAASLIFNDRIDILVDLVGFTRGNRISIFALRPAPIQVRYLGFPGTTGADFFDYFITDRTATPETDALYYTEKFVYMPNCYQVNDHTQKIAKRTWARTELGLPEKGFVFCSFNHPYKIDPLIFDTWMHILSHVPGSVLWLLRGNEIAEKNLKREAGARGVNPGRLIFADLFPKPDHLARLQLAGLALDTRVVNGHITTSDALWAGTPVITVTGNHFISRVSSSILKAVGMPELVTSSLDQYQGLAIHLATHPDELNDVRQRLAANRRTAPLFDTARFTANLENAYREMLNIMISGEKPRQIDVTEPWCTLPLIKPVSRNQNPSEIPTETNLLNSAEICS